MATVNALGDIPELYYSHSDEYNENSPLGWSESMFVVAMHLFHKKYARLADNE